MAIARKVELNTGARRVKTRGNMGRAFFFVIEGTKDQRYAVECCLCGYKALTGNVICEIFPRGMIRPTHICGNCMESIEESRPPDSSEARMERMAGSSKLANWVSTAETSME